MIYSRHICVRQEIESVDTRPGFFNAPVCCIKGPQYLPIDVLGKIGSILRAMAVPCFRTIGSGICCTVAMDGNKKVCLLSIRFLADLIKAITQQDFCFNAHCVKVTDCKLSRFYMLCMCSINN